jgi:predicted Ser/Thr protein kinase
MKLIPVDRNDIEMISKIESMGTWEEERYIADAHNSFDIYTFNGKAYKIYKDSKRTDEE